MSEQRIIGAAPPLSYILDTGADARFVFDPALGMQCRDLPCGRRFHCTPDLETGLRIDAESGAYVFVAGLAIDLNDEGSLDHGTIAARLLAELKNGDAGFLDRLDLIAGRYLVISRRHRGVAPDLLHDACGMFKVNYAPAHGLVSSNIFLIDEVIHGGSRRYRPEFTDKRALWKYGNLGNLAPIDGVRILTANQRLRLGDFRLERFYPRRPVPRIDDVRHAADRIVDLCRRQQSLLLPKFTLLNSLTAGIDSRFSLAIACEASDPQSFFTYVFIRNARVDALIADRIAERLSLKHHILVGASFEAMSAHFKSPVIRISTPPGRSADLHQWDWYQHNNQAVNAYRLDLLPAIDPPSRPLHIRSNLGEIGRAYWNEKTGAPACHDHREILRLSRTDWMQGAAAIFDEFFAETRMDSDSVHGLNLLDVLLWEHESATWVSEVLQGSDFAFNTHSYINCRKVIETFLGVSLEHRLDGSVFRRVIDSRLPALRDLPINPKRLSEARRPAAP